MTKLTNTEAQTSPWDDPFHRKAVATLEERVLIAYARFCPNLWPPLPALNAGERHIAGLLIDRYGDDKVADIIEVLFEHWPAGKLASYSNDGIRPHIPNLSLIYFHREIMEEVAGEFGGFTFKRKSAPRIARLAPVNRPVDDEQREGESTGAYVNRITRRDIEAREQAERDAAGDAQRQRYEETTGLARRRGNTRRDESGNPINA